MRPLLLGLSLCSFSTAQTSTPDPHSVPVVDGGAGPCSADFTVTDSSGAPIYAAKINTHIAYGTWSVRKLDLEVSTNADGKARFTGIPKRMKRGIYFHATEGGREGEVFDDPAQTCTANFTLPLQKK